MIVFSNAVKRYKDMPLPTKASLWFMFTSVLSRGLSFITTPFFTHLLSTDEYGVASIYNKWMTFITIFATFELATGVFNKAMITYEDDRDGYTSSTLFLSSIITLFVFLIYLSAFNFWNDLIGLNTQLMIMMFVDIFITASWSFFAIRNRFEFKYKTIVIITIISNTAATLFSLYLVSIVNENRVEAKIFGSLIVRVLLYIFFYFYLLCKGKKFISLKYWRYALLYNLPLIPHYLSQQILSQSDTIMISKMCGNSDAGLYSLAYQLAITMQIITNAIQASFMPWMFQKIKNKEYDSIGKRALQIELLIGIICVSFSLFAPELIGILGGNEYRSAMYVVPPVSMSVLFLTLYSFIGNVEFYFEKTKFVMLASCIVAIANIILNYIFIGICGFIAAGYTTLLCYICYSMIHYMFMKHICKSEGIINPFNGRAMWFIAAIFACVSIFISIVYEYLLIRYFLILLIILIGIIYFKINKMNILGKKMEE